MYHTEISRFGLPQPQPVEHDLCTSLVARRSMYLKYLRRRTGNLDTAEDLLQDFNLKVIRVAHRNAPVRNPDIWLARVLRNMLFDHYRRCATRRRADAAYSGHITALSGPDGAGSEPAEANPDDARLSGIEAALESIRPDEADLIRWIYLRDQPRESIACQLNISLGTLNVRVLRARRALRDAVMAPASVDHRSAFTANGLAVTPDSLSPDKALKVAKPCQRGSS